jgi:hypothetical protein
MNRPLLFALFLLAAGCSAQADPPSAPIAQASAALERLNPCDPAWQLPTAYRGDPVDDPTFRAFEDQLAAGNSLWIGSLSLPSPYRAIAEVDVYYAGTKKLADSRLWYLAAIPMTSSDALHAVDVFKDIVPVDSKVLGHCLSDTTFVPESSPIPPNAKVTYEITEYDPRCVCSETPTGVISVWE